MAIMDCKHFQLILQIKRAHQWKQAELEKGNPEFSRPEWHKCMSWPSDCLSVLNASEWQKFVNYHRLEANSFLHTTHIQAST